MTPADSKDISSRATMALIGGIVGFAMWMLIEVVPDVLTNPHVFVTVTAAVAGFSGVLLGIVGPVPLRRAVPGALGLAIPAALALGWASLRHETLEGFGDDGLALLAWAVILFVGTPFMAVRLIHPDRWRTYGDLFDFSWSVVVRYSAAWLFAGVFWGILLVSNALFEIVAITIIEDLLDIDPIPHVLTGAVLGLALTVVYEMREYLSPFMVLRLMRILVPVMVVVVGVFAFALPFRDMNNLFGGLSPSATLLVVAIGSITLVSVAVDRSDDRAVALRFMRLATEALAILLVVLAGLAVYAIWLRVDQHGWTPERLAAAIAAGIVAAYAVVYALAVVRRGGWMQRVRDANVWGALGVIGLAFLWLTPVLNPERIATNSQVARYLGGRVSAEDAAIWEMAHDWGRAGQAGLARLAALEGEAHADIRKAIDLAGETDRRHVFQRRAGDKAREIKVADLLANLTVVGSGAELTAEALSILPDFRLDDWGQVCTRASDPGCVVVIGDFGGAGGAEGILFLPRRGVHYDAIQLRFEEGRLIAGAFLRNQGRNGVAEISADDVARIKTGDFEIAPSSRKSLWLDDLEISPDN